MNSSRISARNWILFLIALLCLSQAANLVRLAHAEPEPIGFWRLLGASLLLIPFALKSGAYRPLKSCSRLEWFWIGLSGVFFFSHLWTYFYSAHNTRIANCVVIFSTNPLFTALGAYFFFKEKMSSRLLLAYALAFLSLWQLFAGGWNFNFSFFQEEGWRGDLSGLISAFLYSGYLLTGRRVRSRFSNLAYTSIIYMIASLCFLGNGLLRDVSLAPSDANFLWSILALIIFPTLLGHAVFTYLLKEININLISCGKLIEPIFSTLVAFVLFGESLRPTTLVSFALTSAAVLILFWPLQPKKASRIRPS